MGAKENRNEEWSARVEEIKRQHEHRVAVNVEDEEHFVSEQKSSGWFGSLGGLFSKKNQDGMSDKSSLSRKKSNQLSGFPLDDKDLELLAEYNELIDGDILQKSIEPMEDVDVLENDTSPVSFPSIVLPNQINALSEQDLNFLAQEITRVWFEDGGNPDAIHEYKVEDVRREARTKGNVQPALPKTPMEMLRATMGEEVVKHYFDKQRKMAEEAKMEQEKNGMAQGAADENSQQVVTIEEPEGLLLTEETPLTSDGLATPPMEYADLPDPEPRDAEVRGTMSEDKLHYTVYIIPPAFGGKELDSAIMEAHLKENSIKGGLHQEVIDEIVKEKKYNETIEIATGQMSVHGENGSVIELYPRELKINLQEREDGSVDFKEINTIQTVDKGDVLCEIVPPTLGVDGFTVQGSVLKARNGLAAVVPSGENTVLTPDKLKLTALVDGSLIFRAGKFHVEPVLRVENVDASTGNIRFNGDVLVKGYVQEGYSIQCKGNVKVEGAVEGAVIEAEGSILLKYGINGMGKGCLRAKKEVTAKYIESCEVYAGGKVKAETVVNATVETDEGLEIIGAKGRIVGGNVTSFGSIKVRRVGTRSAVPTTITLGSTPSIVNQIGDTKQKFEALNKEVTEMQQNLSFLEKKQAAGAALTDAHKKLLQQLRLQLPVQKMKLNQVKRTLDELEAKMTFQGSAQLVCQKLYPPTKVVIGRSSLMIQDVTENVRIYLNHEGEISMGFA